MPLSRLSRLVAAMLALGITVPAGQARADEKQECADAYEQAQELRMAHHLVAARARLLVCARPTCPKAAYEDCTRWLGEVEAALPTAIVRALGAQGEPLSDVRVLVDGQPSEPAARGEEVPLDPGKHAVRVEAPGHAPVESTLTLAEAEKGHVDSVTLAEAPGAAPEPATAPPTEAPRRTRPNVPALAALAVGAVALGSWGYFGIRGVADRNGADSCLPHCPDDQVSHVNGELLAADVSLGIAVVALGVAAWLWLSAAPGPATTHAGLAPWEVRF